MKRYGKVAELIRRAKEAATRWLTGQRRRPQPVPGPARVPVRIRPRR